MDSTPRNNTTIPVRVDRSHIVTIGRRLYSESIELIRELVNNAYDADATEVRVTIREDEIEVADNGLGMDLEGLRQYFNIGSQEKLYHDIETSFPLIKTFPGETVDPLYSSIAPTIRIYDCRRR